MRLPLSKLYRAFPELDRFTDEQCRAYVARAQRRNLWRTVGGFLAALTAMLLTWMCAGTILGVGAGALIDRLQDDATSLWIVTSGFAAVVFLGALCALVVRDLWLRWLVRMELRGARCPGCDYSLLGLRVENDGVVCPECGASLSLTTMGLTPEDLIAVVVTP